MESRRLQDARGAFLAKDAEESKRVHQQHLPERHRQAHGRYIKSFVYGGLDGIITTFAVVAGVAGASLSPGVVLILGFANLVADGLSMAIGDFLSTKAENEYNAAERERENWEIENYPEGEKEEMIELYTEKGLSKEDAGIVVEILSKNKKLWVDIMMVEELGIVESDESPLRNAVATFISFSVFGFVPLLAYLIPFSAAASQRQTFGTAGALTGLTLFALGAIRARITDRNWFVSGMEMFLIGGVAAVAAFGIGHLLSGLA